MIYTIGHSTRSLDDLAGALGTHGVETVVDVRHYPRSRTNPQFNADALAKDLPLRGIRYVHLAQLGGRRRDEQAAEPTDGWEVAAFRAYAAYAQGPEFAAGLAELLALAEDSTVAIMCSEAVWWRCHRRIITDYLLARGVPVRHIVGNKAEDAAMTPFARPTGSGLVAYRKPGAPSGR